MSDCIGPRGRLGATGPAGPNSGGSEDGLISFSAAIPEHTGALSSFYLANPGGSGADIAADLATSPLQFPIPEAKTFTSLAVRLPNVDAFGSESSAVTFTVTKNGVDTALTVTFDINTVDFVQIATADVVFAAGDRYDLRMDVTSTISAVTNAAAGISL